MAESTSGGARICGQGKQAPGRNRLPGNPAPVLLLVLGLLASGCGFHLRGTGGGVADLPPVMVQGAPRDPLGVALRRSVPRPGEAPGAPLVLVLDQVVRDRRPVSVTDRARVAEYALRTDVVFRLLDAEGRLVARDRLGVERTYRLDAANLLGASGEEEVLRSEMRRQLVNGVLRRIAAEAAGQAPAPGTGSAGTGSGGPS